jgi:hypothetical protein
MKNLLAAMICGALVVAATTIRAEEGKPTRRTDKTSAFAAPAEYQARDVATKAPLLGTDLLTWDDGSFENALGPTGGHYDGQFAMRFGGAAATTGLVPFKLLGAYWRLDSGDPGITNVNINFWHPLTAGGFPASAAPLVQVPGNTVTGVTQSVTIPAGPTISTANGSVMVGVGGLGTTGWFIDRDTDGPDNDREFAGSNADNTLPLSFGPATLGTLGFSGNFFVRLLVDGNIPVELEKFTIE